MEKINHYKEIIKKWLLEECQIQPFYEKVEKVLIVDGDSGHFQLLMQGWHENQYVHQLIFHLQVKTDGKVWIWLNQSDQRIASELVERGIPKTDIVLGFQPPQFRQYTQYASA